MSLQRLLHCVSALSIALVATAAVSHGASAGSVRPLASAGSKAPVIQPNSSLANGAHPNQGVVSASNGLKREVFGFALASSLSDPTVGYPSWNFSLLSTVAFFGLHINWDGTVVGDSAWNVWNSSALSGLLSTAHSKGTKVVVTIDLQDFQPGTPTMCAGLINRAVTVGEAVAQAKAKGVDGVNVDYEGLNGPCQNGQTARSMMTDFLSQLRAALPAGAYLSVDTYASSASDPLGFFDIPALNASVDSFFVMAYDLEYSNYRRAPTSCGSFCLGPTAPLSGYYYNDTSAAGQYMTVVPASKVILGVPYYGRKACVGGPVANAYPSGLVTADSYLDAAGESADSSVQPGSYTVHRDANDPAGQGRWDTWYNPSLGCTRELYWDDVVSLGAKYDLVTRDGLRGVGIWSLNYGGGAPELWSTLASHFAACASVSVSASPISSAAVGKAVTLTASATGCANPLYQFWMSSPGATTWQVVQAYSASSIFNWNTTGAAVGAYTFSVWVRDATGGGAFSSSSGRWDAYTAVPYSLVQSCPAVSFAAVPASSALVGTLVTVTATASGCSNPVYQFWMSAPGASSWQIVQAYSASTTFGWNTTGAAAGRYTFSVWVRDGSGAGEFGSGSGRWDAWIAGSYALTARQCSTVSFVASPATSATIGSAVALTATATGCSNPVYQFWMSAPGASSWQIVQAYSASPTFSWNTAVTAAGTYTFSVWVRDAIGGGAFSTSSGRWDVYTSGQYSLVKPCSSVSFEPSPVASATIGSLVTITATASGCSNPVFQFWMSAPGASGWQIVQAYSPSPTLTWNTAGAAVGTYTFAVWVRDAIGGGAFSSGSGRWDVYTSGQYSLVKPCSTVSFTASPAASASIASPVTVTARATGCSNPVFQFWMSAPGASSWQIVQAYSISPTFSWNTTGAAPGTYTFSVWVRDAAAGGAFGSSSGRWDAWSYSQYLLVKPCSSLSFTISPSASASIGTPVKVTATATGCSNPVYQFWMSAPGASTWQIVQAYSTSSTFNWNTTGAAAGTYTFSVWVRDAGGGAYSSSSGRWDSYTAGQYLLR